MNDALSSASATTIVTDVEDGSATRATLAVPSPSTSLVAGEGTVPGVQVTTSEHIRFNAEGPRDESDAIAQATGQLWLQATQNLVGIAKKKLVVSSRGSTAIAASKGISFVAGFAPERVASETEPGVLPSGITSYEDSTTTAAAAVTIVNTVMLAVTAAAKTAGSLVGNGFTWGPATAAAVNVAGSIFNGTMIGGKRDADLPGVSLYSQAGTLVGSLLAGINVFGVPGVLFASPFTTHHGLWGAKLRGYKRTSASAIKSVDVQGLDVTVRAKNDTVVASRLGTLTLRGAQMWIGTPNRASKPWTWRPQIPTQTTTFSAMSSIELTGHDLKFESEVGNFKSLATKETSLAATEAFTFDLCDGAWTFEVTKGGVTAGTPTMKVLSIASDGSVSLVGTAKALVSPTATRILCGPGSLEVTPGVSIAINGTELKIQ